MIPPKARSGSIPLPKAAIVREGAPFALAQPSPDNLRRLHRVSLVHGPAIRLEVRRADGRKLVGVVEDICWSGVAVRFDLGSDPRIKPEQVGVVVVTALRLPDVELKARVASVDPLANGGTRYGLHFIDDEELRQRVTPEWRRWFSQRRRPRFTPRADLAAKVSVTWRGGSTYARVADASMEGLGVEVELGPARSIVLARTIGLLLSFPGSQGPLRLHAVVRGSKQGPDGVRLGLEYLPDDLLDLARPRLEAWIGRLRAQESKDATSRPGF
ncbi:MAG: PilZ domain-containing protein [Planctomycetes bacterium]|nr:PilZ domain-containing protein [Planctomycetota bacterium]